MGLIKFYKKLETRLEKQEPKRIIESSVASFYTTISAAAAIGLWLLILRGCSAIDVYISTKPEESRCYERNSSPIESSRASLNYKTLDNSIQMFK